MQKLGAWKEEAKQRVADLLFSQDSGIGLSCWRFNLGGGINPRITHPWRTAETFETAPGSHDWTRQAGERWFLRAAKARGVPQFLAFAVSPPTSMTRNGLTFTSPDGGTTNLKAGFEPRFAGYLADILQHFRDNPNEAERIAFNYVSPVNEPQWEWDGHTQEGCRYSNRDIKNVVRALAKDLEKRRLRTEIVVVESGSLPDMWSPNEKMTKKYATLYGNYIDDLAGDAEVRPFLGRRLGYHSYGSDRLNGPLVSHRQRLREKMKAYPDWRLWQTEYCILDGAEGQGGSGRDLGMSTALEVARIIHFDLSLANASAWQWWTAVSPEDYKDGLVYTDYKKRGDAETIYPSRLLWTLGHYSRFVRPGMRRITLEGDSHDAGGLLGSAFKDPTARRAVLVYLNLSSHMQKVEPVLRGAMAQGKGARLTPFVTSDRPGYELRKLPALGLRQPFEVPPRSACTMVIDFET